MATSITPLVIPARHAVADRTSSDGEKPIAAIAAAKAKPATIDAGPLRKRCATRPVSGMATIPPAAKARSAKLSPASESARSALTRGIGCRPRANSEAIRQEDAECRPGAAAKAPRSFCLRQVSRRASITRFVRPCARRRTWLAGKPPQTCIGGLGAENLIPRSANARATDSGASASRTTRSKAFGLADCERRAAFELFVQDRRGDAARVAQKRSFDLRVLRIKGGGSREPDRGRRRRGARVQGAKPRSRPRPGLRRAAPISPADPASDQPERNLGLGQQGRGDRRIMRRCCDRRSSEKAFAAARFVEPESTKTNEPGGTRAAKARPSAALRSIASPART